VEVGPQVVDQSIPALTDEDWKRAADRRRVLLARMRGRSPLLLWLLVGPGILVMLGENDAPSMISYAQTGAQYGIGFFVPFIALTFLMAYVVQEMTVRLGAVTHRGHAEMIFARFGPFWGWFSLTDLGIGNFLTLVTEFIGIRAGLSFFGIPPVISVGVSVLLIVGATATARYWTWERIALGLAAFNCLFVPAAILAHPNWGAVSVSFVKWGPLPGGLSNSVIFLLIADIGATVTPWMLFFQQSAVTDKGLTKRDLLHGRIDTALGAVLAAGFAIAALIAASVLFAKGINTSSFGDADFAQHLQPIIGRVGATLFALGIFEAGLVAAIAISTSSAYAFGEVTRKARSHNRTLRDGLPFHLMLILSALGAAALVLLPGLPLVFFVLIVNVVAVLAMPPAVVLLLLMVNDRDVMGTWCNGKLGNVAAITTTVFLVLASILFGVTIIFPNLFG
jgi:Mn2+/Fe2+ NRAMP family transporter